MPGPDDKKTKEKNENKTGADFEELSRLARERDYAELEQRRQRAVMIEAEYNRKMADYKAAVDQLENDLGIKLEDIDRLHTVARKYGFRDSSYKYALRTVTGKDDPLYEIIEPLRQSNDPEDVKKKKYYEGIFEQAKKEYSWLKNWNADVLLQCADISIPERPLREEAAGEKSRASFEAELKTQEAEYVNAFRKLKSIMDDYDKKHPDSPHTVAEKKMEKFWDQFWDIYNATSQNNSLDEINAIREAMTPKKHSDGDKIPISPADNMLDLYLEYLREVHSDQEPTKIVPTEEEKAILGLVTRCLSSMTRYADMLDAALNGDLFVPPAEQEYENGKKIHRVNAVGKEPKMTKRYITKRNNDAGVAIGFDNMRFAPLFRNGPKPSDVVQGKLGDCYFLAALATIAAQNPALIRNAMKDNGDGSITVRFFTENREPIYVSVDKTVPRVNGSSPYAQDDGESLWVQIMEKAYVQSGLRVRGGLSKAEAGTLLSNYEDIESGYEGDAISNIVGTGQGFFVDSSHCLDIPSSSDNNGYSQKELVFVNELKSALADGQLLTAAFSGKRDGLFGTPLDEKHKTVSGFGAQESGMYTQHAYSLHSVEEENGKYYITVRNPHGHKGVNTLSDGSLISADTGMAAGYSRLELRDFAAYFTYVSISRVDLTAASEERMAESKNLIRHYGEAVRKITEALKSTDNTLMIFKNSKKFREFRDASISLHQIMQSQAPTEKKLNDGMEKFLEKAKAYSDQCEKDKKINPFKDSHRAFVRYQAARIASELKLVYEANKGKTLREKWEEFSWSAAAKKTDVPTTPEALLGIYRTAADGMAKRLNTREGDFANSETRNKLYTFLKDFAETGSAERLNREFFALKTEGERFDCLRSDARTVCTMHFIHAHAEDILRAMERDGFRVENSKLKKMLLSEEINFDPQRSKANRPNDEGVLL